MKDMELDDLFGKPKDKKYPWDTGFHVAGLPKKILTRDGKETGYSVNTTSQTVTNKEGKIIALVSGVLVQRICTLEGVDTGYFISGISQRNIFYSQPAD